MTLQLVALNVGPGGRLETATDKFKSVLSHLPVLALLFEDML